MTTTIVTWDWKEQPDLPEIAAAVNTISGNGQPVHMREYETGGDCYCWIIADHEVSDEEAGELYRS